MSIDPGDSLPLYQQVADDIRRKIASGAMPIGHQLQPHRELATSYGVSVVTINKALSGLVTEGVLTSRVGRGTFVADRFGMAASAKRGDMIGFVLRDLNSPFFSLVAHSAQQAADAAGYALVLSASSNRLDREEEQLHRFCALGVKGLLIVSMSRTYRLSASIKQLHDSGFPYVMVSYTHGDDVPFVGLDLEKAGYLATQHLIRLGRKRIGYISDRHGSLCGELRGQGYRRALGEFSAVFDPAFLFEYPYEGEWNDYRSGYAIGEQVADLSAKPDAMFVFNDLGALGFQDALLDHGMRVPDDIAVVGLDDIEMAARARVPLTTVSQHAERIGALAVETLIAKMRGERPAVRQLLAPELIVRQSCGSPAPAGRRKGAHRARPVPAAGPS